MSPEEADVWRTAITAGSAVAGTLLGALLGIAGTYLIERSRRRYEDRNRFLPEKRERYTAFQQRIEDSINAWTIHLAERESHGVPPDDGPRPESNITAAIGDIRLLNRDVADAAQAVVDVLYTGDWLLPADPRLSPYQRAKPVRDRVAPALTRFSDLASKDLGTRT